MFESFTRNKYIIILAHLSAWIAFFFIPYFMWQGEPHPVSPPKFRDLPFEGICSLVTLSMVIFYTNYGFLVPRILNRFGTRYYLLTLLPLWIVFGLGIFLIKLFFVSDKSNFPLLLTTFPFILLIAVSLAIRLLIDRNRVENDLKDQKYETLKSELAFLRSQISPHFLFNIMNNVVALSRIEPQKVEPTLIQLSQLMRYMLYNSDEKKVNILKEINYLESYIDLQKLRFGEAVKVIFEHSLPPFGGTEGGQIEPMLLIPFIENAFKHGTGLIDKPLIEISLIIENNTLIFKVLNKYNPLSKETKDKDSGIGLKNVSRRLDLLYGNNHTLIIDKTDTFFKVNLTLKLDKP